MPNKRPSRRSRKGAHICKHCRQSKHRNHSFKKYSHKKHKHCRHTRRRGGADVFVGAPVESSLAGDWSSRMSQGQGEDYLKYHQGQHGGGITGAPYPTAVILSISLSILTKSPPKNDVIPDNFAEEEIRLKLSTNVVVTDVATIGL